MPFIIVQIIVSLLFPALTFGQTTERQETIVIPVSSLGDVSEIRKRIIQNSLTQELSKYFRVVPQNRFEAAQEKAFEQLEYEECTEDQCIMLIQEMLQVENLFHLEIIREEGDTQLNLKWVNLDEKRNTEFYCEGCKKKFGLPISGLSFGVGSESLLPFTQRESNFRIKIFIL